MSSRPAGGGLRRGSGRFEVEQRRDRGVTRAGFAEALVSTRIAAALANK